ncbi:MAG: adenylosuccinate synthase [Parcubacteria group bacterium Gr01-1014_31]|nr:MAG: adenylosuccinate synthase [Parcubacteria group bacterium Gr01-1014_31]
MSDAPCIGIVGAFGGDEGKGKVVDVLAQNAGCVVRCEGGANAGHTIRLEDLLFIGHLLPSGAAAGTLCAIARGVRVDPMQLLQEVGSYTAPGAGGKCRTLALLVDEGAALSLPWHVKLEEYFERVKEKRVRGTGSTRRGMGPIAATAALRLNPRVGLLTRPEELRQWLDDFFEAFHPLLAEAGNTVTPAALAELLAGHGAQLAPYVGDVRARVEQVWRGGDPVVLEGAQGMILDPYWGTYPYTTQGMCTFAGLLQGCGLPVSALTDRIGVCKAIATRVGNGPFPSELGDPAKLAAEPKVVDADLDAFAREMLTKINAGHASDQELGFYLRVRADEYGATTGRHRRTGWLDGAWLEYFAAVNDPTALALTKLDCLGGLREVKIVVAYELDGRHLPPGTVPALASDYARVRPVYQTLPGWSEDISDVTRFDALPAEARAYVELVEEIANCPIGWIGTGPLRRQLIIRPH